MVSLGAISRVLCCPCVGTVRDPCVIRGMSIGFPPLAFGWIWIRENPEPGPDSTLPSVFQIPDEESLDV